VLHHKATCRCLPGYNGTPVSGCQGKAVANITIKRVTQEDNFLGENYYLFFLYTPIYIYAIIFPALLIGKASDVKASFTVNMFLLVTPM
jgi:hypothetical protein